NHHVSRHAAAGHAGVRPGRPHRPDGVRLPVPGPRGTTRRRDGDSRREARELAGRHALGRVHSPVARRAMKSCPPTAPADIAALGRDFDPADSLQVSASEEELKIATGGGGDLATFDGQSDVGATDAGDIWGILTT